jgi:predicted transposase/invertase (TIGR01784 family)
MWVAFLTRHDLLKADNLPQALNDDSLRKAIKVLYVMNFTPEERDAYEDHLKCLRIEHNTLKKAESIAKSEGLAAGLAEGEVKGKLEIAKNLIAKGFDDKTILELTGLTVEEVKKYFP